MTGCCAINKACGLAPAGLSRAAPPTLREVSVKFNFFPQDFERLNRTFITPLEREDILWAWVLTMPMSALVAALCYLALRAFGRA